MGSKSYNEHTFNSKKQLETFFSGKVKLDLAKETMIFPVKKLCNGVDQGLIKGSSLIDISGGSFMHLLCSICDVFKEITLLKFSDQNVADVTKWLNSHTGPFDWSYMAAILEDLKGVNHLSNAPEYQIRSVVKQVLKCDLEKDNLTEPTELPQADYVMVAGALEMVSNTKEEFVRNIKKAAALVKPGGHLIFFGVLGATFYQIGEEKYQIFTYDENLIKNILAELKFTIRQSDTLQTKSKNQVIDYKGILYLLAQRKA